jgi:hypothetical protein
MKIPPSIAAANHGLDERRWKYAVSVIVGLANEAVQ